MHYETISQGYIYQPSEGFAAGPRSVFLDGEIVCSFMETRKLTTNDFVPMIARSSDGGKKWVLQGAVWPEFMDKYSLFISISRDIQGVLYLYGSRCRIDKPGESNWSNETYGLKENELIWSQSFDKGKTWSDPSVIPMPIPGSAEAPGPMCIGRNGNWYAVYAPNRTFDPVLSVELNQIAFLKSKDKGKTWSYKKMLRFHETDGGAESWVIELADGRLLGTSWNFSWADSSDHPNAYAISLNGGDSWEETRSTGIMGQSTGLAALPDGRALFIYNHRKPNDGGIGLAVAKPDPDHFNVEMNAIVWRAESSTQSGEVQTDHTSWEDYSFGEPSVTPISDGLLLVAFWTAQPSGNGIAYRILKFKK